MYDYAPFETLFEDESFHKEMLPEGVQKLTVENRHKPAPLAVYYHADSAYPFTVEFAGVCAYFVTEEEAFDYTCDLYDGDKCVLNFFSLGVSRLRYAFPVALLDLEGTVESFAVSAAGTCRALANLIAALVAKGDCVCRLRNWDGSLDQSIIIANK